MSVDSFKLELPVKGTETKDWVVNYFVAHQKAGQYKDFRGGPNTYPKLGTDEHRHTGTDFCVPNFRWMDKNFPVYASASGKVIFSHDGEPDRNTSRRSPGGLGNCVKIKHPNGFTALYGHLKNGSISVKRGQYLGVGRTIGVVGSSGRSDGPHLHFELRDKDGDVVDPSQKGYWINPPTYDPPFSIMDFSVQDGKTNLYESRTPPRKNLDSFYSDQWITVGFFMCGLRANEKISARLGVGDVQSVNERSLRECEIENFMIYYAHLYPPASGLGIISISIDGKLAHEYRVEMKSSSRP